MNDPKFPKGATPLAPDEPAKIIETDAGEDGRFTTFSAPEFDGVLLSLIHI